MYGFTPPPPGERDARKKQGVTVTQFLNTHGRVDRQNQATVAKKPGVHS